MRPISPKIEVVGQPASQEQAKLKQACQDFESLLLAQVWRAMQSTLQQKPERGNMVEMFDLQFAEGLAKAGGIGLADSLQRQLAYLQAKETKDE
ncbi:MAG: rod-binding protein [Armatimonadetes bacterium]|nr:rod-binding protein [Armatimonadota bacterium]